MACVVQTAEHCSAPLEKGPQYDVVLLALEDKMKISKMLYWLLVSKWSIHEAKLFILSVDMELLTDSSI